MAVSAFAAGWLTAIAAVSLATAFAVLLAAAVGSGVFVDAVAWLAAVGVAATAGVGLPSAFVAGSTGPCAAAAMAGFDASTVDVLVAIAAAAIARGSVALPLDIGATTAAATGTAIATATGAGVTAVDAAGCGDAAGSAIVVESVATVMSDAASLTAVFTIPDFVPSGVAGLAAVPASALASAATVCAAPGCASCERVLVAAAEEDALSRGCRLSDAADVSSERCCCCCCRSGAAGRSLLAVSAALLSINAEKLSGAGDWSARADLDGAF